MIITITGGSGSGKSALGEAIAQKLTTDTKYYIATMEAFGEEAQKRIAKHRQMRADKNFQTIECTVNLGTLDLPRGSTAMLECMSNLVANEMFSDAGCFKNNPSYLPNNKYLEHSIENAITKMAINCNNLIIITNEVFSDTLEYPRETLEYIENLGKINQMLFKISDVCIESVYSIPVYHKGALPWQL